MAIKSERNRQIGATWQIVLGLILAAVCWYVVFSPASVVNFWIGLAVAAGLLAMWSLYCTGIQIRSHQLTFKAVVMGVGAAFLLYLIFAFGNFLSAQLFHFAAGQVGNIYSLKGNNNLFWVACLLIFVTSPCEEIFWRGFIQKWAMAKIGTVGGYLLAAFLYMAVHIVSGNFMLIMAALVAGLFWGLLYIWQKGNLVPVIISHMVWTVSIFILFPIM